MRSCGRWAVAMLTTLNVALLGCARAPQVDDFPDTPAVIGKADRNGIKSVRLSRQASDRLGVETAMVEESPATGSSAGSRPGRSAGPRKAIPYSAVLYDPDGVTWVYTVPRPLTYVRQKVVVVTVGGTGGTGGTEAVLSMGPPAGTTIVSTGVIELYGAELGVGR